MPLELVTRPKPQASNRWHCLIRAADWIPSNTDARYRSGIWPSRVDHPGKMPIVGRSRLNFDILAVPANGLYSRLLDNDIILVVSIRDLRSIKNFSELSI